MISKYKARKERQEQASIVRPRVEIEDPSAEILSSSRTWDFEDPLQASFLEKPEVPRPKRDPHRVPKLKYRKTEPTAAIFHSSQHSPDDEDDSDRDSITSSEHSASDDSAAWEKLSSMAFDPEVISSLHPTNIVEDVTPPVPQRHPKHTPAIPIRSRSLPLRRDESLLSTSLPTPAKATFQAFSQRCAPSPYVPVSVPAQVFELPADHIEAPVYSKDDTDAPIELEGSPVDRENLQPAPLQVQSKTPPEQEPEASPYNRFTALVKSVHALNASLSTIAETEEEAASRRSSRQVHELPAMTHWGTFPLSAYTGGTSITPRVQRHSGLTPELASGPFRNLSTRSTQSTASTHSNHSMFSFDFGNSDTEKIYISSRGHRRESSAPSLTDVSSIDDFDLELELDPELRRTRSNSKREAKLERFFGIRQYSVGSESDTSLNLDTPQATTAMVDTASDGNRNSTASVFIPTDKNIRPSTSIDDLDLSLAEENDPYRREIILMHKSILAKTQIKQAAKLQKLLGCDRESIEVARKASTGSRLAGNTDDLKYRTIGRER